MRIDIFSFLIGWLFGSAIIAFVVNILKAYL